MNSPERRLLITAVFRERFNAEPEVWARAPGRVDLMGSHTDYNLGYVLTLPIGRDAWIAAARRQDRVVCIQSINLDANAMFSLDSPGSDQRQPWSNYVAGVASALANEGFRPQGFNGVIHSTVPISSGLSSSAALECAAATIFEAHGGWKLEPVQKALLCQRAENQFVGVNCGILDQYTSCLGQEGCALLLNCRDLASKPVKIAPDICVVICDTKSKRELVGSKYGARRAQCEEGARRLGIKALREITVAEFELRATELPVEVARRCRFIVEENARVLALAAALPGPDRDAIRRLTADSFRGACDLYEIGAPAMQAMMDAMLKAPGVIGARQAGAGFGGCMVAFVERAAAPDFAATVCAQYSEKTRITPDVYPVEAAAGAGLIP